MILISCFLIPFHSLCIVFLHAVASIVANTQHILSVGITLFSSLPIPFNSFGRVLSHAFALVIKLSKIVFGWRKTLFGSLAKPFGCFSRILFHTIAFDIHQAKITLGNGIARFGFCLCCPKRFIRSQLSACTQNKQQKTRSPPFHFHTASLNIYFLLARKL